MRTLQVSVAPGFQRNRGRWWWSRCGRSASRWLGTCGPRSFLPVVAGHEVPHHNLVGSFQREILVGEHMAVGRAEQEGREPSPHCNWCPHPFPWKSSPVRYFPDNSWPCIQIHGYGWRWLPMRCPRSTMTIRNSSGCFVCCHLPWRRWLWCLLIQQVEHPGGVTSGMGPSSKVR